MTTKTARYYVVKTVCVTYPAEMMKSGKAETISTDLYYKGGAWVAEWAKDGANKMPIDRAKKIVLGLDNNNFNETFDWIKA